MSSDGQPLELLNLLLVLCRLLRAASLLDELALSSLHVAAWITGKSTAHHICHFSVLLWLLLVLLLLLDNLLSSSLLALQVRCSSPLVVIVLVSLLNRLI
jgi:uncharacterized integral membrane protein